MRSVLCRLRGQRYPSWDSGNSRGKRCLVLWRNVLPAKASTILSRGLAAKTEYGPWIEHGLPLSDKFRRFGRWMPPSPTPHKPAKLSILLAQMSMDSRLVKFTNGAMNSPRWGISLSPVISTDNDLQQQWTSQALSFARMKACLFCVSDCARKFYWWVLFKPPNLIRFWLGAIPLSWQSWSLEVNPCSDELHIIPNYPVRPFPVQNLNTIP